MARRGGPWWRFVRWAFYLLYNQLAWSYDLVSWTVSLGQWRAWQRAGLPFLQGKDILELAHGPGHMLLALKQAGCRVTGFDLSPYMGRQARRRLARAGLVGEVPLIRGRAQALPFAAGSFDSVLATFPAEFIVAPASLAGLRRILRPGGRLVIIPEARLTGRGLLRAFIEWLYTITGQRVAPDDSMSASPLWSGARAALEKHGFTVAVEQVELPRSLVTVVVCRRFEL